MFGFLPLVCEILLHSLQRNVPCQASSSGLFLTEISFAYKWRCCYLYFTFLMSLHMVGVSKSMALKPHLIFHTHATSMISSVFVFKDHCLSVSISRTHAMHRGSPYSWLSHHVENTQLQPDVSVVSNKM